MMALFKQSLQVAKCNCFYSSLTWLFTGKYTSRFVSRRRAGGWEGQSRAGVRGTGKERGLGNVCILCACVVLLWGFVCGDT